MSSPLGVDPIRDARREFEAVLNRLDAAIGRPSEYGPVEHLADLETVRKFVNSGMWDCLSYAEQRRYQARIVDLQRRGRREGVTGDL